MREKKEERTYCACVYGWLPDVMSTDVILTFNTTWALKKIFGVKYSIFVTFYQYCYAIRTITSDA